MQREARHEKKYKRGDVEDETGEKKNTAEEDATGEVVAPAGAANTAREQKDTEGKSAEHLSPRSQRKKRKKKNKPHLLRQPRR